MYSLKSRHEHNKVKYHKTMCIFMVFPIRTRHIMSSPFSVVKYLGLHYTFTLFISYCSLYTMQHRLWLISTINMQYFLSFLLTVTIFSGMFLLIIFSIKGFAPAYIIAWRIHSDHDAKFSLSPTASVIDIMTPFGAAYKAKFSYGFIVVRSLMNLSVQTLNIWEIFAKCNHIF